MVFYKFYKVYIYGISGVLYQLFYKVSYKEFFE